MDIASAHRPELRRNATDAERVLWRLLGSRQLAGVKFRRQHLVGPYLLHFFSAEHGLAVELDGGRAHDGSRTDYLARCGVRVLRFRSRELFEQTDGVLEAIRRAVGS